VNKESFFISLFNSKRIGDDAALVEGWVVSADAFCEEVHFRRDWMSLEQIGAKAMLVNISDSLAMNAEPKYALLSVALPKSMTPAQMEELAKGINESARGWGVEIVGGDTVAADKIDISITLLAKTKRPLFRKPLKEGYLVGYTGELGSVGKDLRRLLRGARVSSKSKFVRPRLRRAFMKRSSRVLKVAMDISDGLFDDMAKLSKLNRVGFEFIKKIPKSEGCSGEEYEILFALHPKELPALLRRAKASRTKVTIVAKVVRGKFVNPCKPNHF
jgi:thiamine-monophosphate kinase